MDFESCINLESREMESMESLRIQLARKDAQFLTLKQKIIATSSIVEAYKTCKMQCDAKDKELNSIKKQSETFRCDYQQLLLNHVAMNKDYENIKKLHTELTGKYNLLEISEKANNAHIVQLKELVGDLEEKNSVSRIELELLKNQINSDVIDKKHLLLYEHLILFGKKACSSERLSGVEKRIYRNYVKKVEEYKSSEGIIDGFNSTDLKNDLHITLDSLEELDDLGMVGPLSCASTDTGLGSSVYTSDDEKYPSTATTPTRDGVFCSPTYELNSPFTKYSNKKYVKLSSEDTALCKGTSSEANTKRKQKIFVNTATSPIMNKVSASNISPVLKKIRKVSLVDKASSPIRSRLFPRDVRFTHNNSEDSTAPPSAGSPRKSAVKSNISIIQNAPTSDLQFEDMHFGNVTSESIFLLSTHNGVTDKAISLPQNPPTLKLKEPKLQSNNEINDNQIENILHEMRNIILISPLPWNDTTETNNTNVDMPRQAPKTLSIKDICLQRRARHKAILHKQQLNKLHTKKFKRIAKSRISKKYTSYFATIATKIFKKLQNESKVIGDTILANPAQLTAPAIRDNASLTTPVPLQNHNVDSLYQHSTLSICKGIIQSNVASSLSYTASYPTSAENIIKGTAVERNETTFLSASSDDNAVSSQSPAILITSSEHNITNDIIDLDQAGLKRTGISISRDNNNTPPCQYSDILSTEENIPKNNAVESRQISQKVLSRVVGNNTLFQHQMPTVLEAASIPCNYKNTNMELNINPLAFTGDYFEAPSQYQSIDVPTTSLEQNVPNDTKVDLDQKQNTLSVTSNDATSSQYPTTILEQSISYDHSDTTMKSNTLQLSSVASGTKELSSDNDDVMEKELSNPANVNQQVKVFPHNLSTQNPLLVRYPKKRTTKNTSKRISLMNNVKNTNINDFIIERNRTRPTIPGHIHKAVDPISQCVNPQDTCEDTKSCTTDTSNNYVEMSKKRKQHPGATDTSTKKIKMGVLKQDLFSCKPRIQQNNPKQRHTTISATKRSPRLNNSLKKTNDVHQIQTECSALHIKNEITSANTNEVGNIQEVIVPRINSRCQNSNKKLSQSKVTQPARLTRKQFLTSPATDYNSHSLVGDATDSTQYKNMLMECENDSQVQTQTRVDIESEGIVTVASHCLVQKKEENTTKQIKEPNEFPHPIPSENGNIDINKKLVSNDFDSMLTCKTYIFKSIIEKNMFTRKHSLNHHSEKYISSLQVLFQKQLSTDLSKEKLDNLINILSTMKKKHIAQAMIEFLCSNKAVTQPKMDAKFDANNEILMPEMNQGHALVLCCLNRIHMDPRFAHQSYNITELVMKGIEFKSFTLNKTPELPALLNIGLLYALLCKLTKQKDKLKVFCMDAIYCMSYKATPLIYNILLSWPHLFPRSYFYSGQDPLIVVIIHYLLSMHSHYSNYECDKIKSLLFKRYNYKAGEVNDDILREKLISSVKDTKDNLPMNNIQSALLLMGKRCGYDWCHKNIILKGLIPILDDKTASAESRAQAAQLVGVLLRPFPDSMRMQCEILTKKLCSMLQKGDCPIVEEGLVRGLSYMVVNNFTEIIKVLIRWKPKQPVSEYTLELMKLIVPRKSEMFWNQFIINHG